MNGWLDFPILFRYREEDSQIGASPVRPKAGIYFFIQHLVSFSAIDMFYVYVLQEKLGEIYIGSSRDLQSRMKQHRSKKVYSTRTGLWKLSYYEAYRAETDARRREHQLKYHGQAKARLKERLKDSLKET